MSASAAPGVEQLVISSFEVPTDAPEADGTLAWNKTVLVTVEAASAGVTGLGYTYADIATAGLIERKLAQSVLGRSVWAVEQAHHAMRREVRNLGNDGITAMAISAVDVALWDLKARLLGVSLSDLLGRAHDAIPVYGSGGFTSYPNSRLQAQLAGWIEQGFGMVKMKVGSDPRADPSRVHAAREAIGREARLFVDANGAYSRKQALALADAFAALGVSWFEEPVSSDDLAGLSLMVERAPAGMDVAAGEYGYRAPYFETMLAARAVDVLQADATRCGGVTGYLQAAALCQAHCMPLSSHCAPALHAQLACATQATRHLEYFHDHARIEHMLFEDALTPRDGKLIPDHSRAGLGIRLRQSEADRYRTTRAVKHKDRT